jgi:hypothetical protein
MLSESIETRHLVAFKQALYYLEIFDREGVEWNLDQENVLRKKDPSGSIDTETSWGELGFVEDWFIERIELKAGDWSPTLYTLKCAYRGRKKPLASLYSIGHRRGQRRASRPGGPWLAKRRKLTCVNPWIRFIESYLETRRVSRILETTRYQPTNQNIEAILLVAAPFIQTRKRQIEERAFEGFDNQRLGY